MIRGSTPIQPSRSGKTLIRAVQGAPWCLICFSFGTGSRVVFGGRTSGIFQHRSTRDPLSVMLLVPYYPSHRLTKI